MQTKLICAIGLLAAVVALCACSRNKSIADDLTQADRVVVTNRDERGSITITGADVQKLVAALSTSKRESQKIDSTGSGHRLEFFKGSNHLGGVQTSYGISGLAAVLTWIKAARWTRYIKGSAKKAALKN